MMLTVALATLRTRWVAFAGTLAALALGVSVIATMALVLAAANGGGGHQSPERFAAAPFVIQADPALRVHDADGVDTVPLLAAARRSRVRRRATARRDHRPQLLRPARGRARRPAGARSRLVERGLRPLPPELRPPAEDRRRDRRRRAGRHRPVGHRAHGRRTADLHDRRHRAARGPASSRSSSPTRRRPGSRPGLTRW